MHWRKGEHNEQAEAKQNKTPEGSQCFWPGDTDGFYKVP